MVAFQRNVAAFESLVLQNFHDVQSQLAQANRTNRGNAQQLMSLKQMTRIMARMVAIESDRSLVAPPQAAASGQHARRRAVTSGRLPSSTSMQPRQRTLVGSSRTVGFQSARSGTYQPPVLTEQRAVGSLPSPPRGPRNVGTGSPGAKPRTPAAIRAASARSGVATSNRASGSSGTPTGVALQTHKARGRPSSRGKGSSPLSPVVAAVAATGSESARSYDSAGSGGTSGGGVSDPAASLEALRQQRLGTAAPARGVNGHARASSGAGVTNGLPADGNSVMAVGSVASN